MDEKKKLKAEDTVVVSDADVTDPATEASAKEGAKPAPKMRGVEAVEEIRVRRTENSKVFRMSDGTEQAVFYPHAVHVYDEDTQTFEDIDDEFVEDENVEERAFPVAIDPQVVLSGSASLSTFGWNSSAGAVTVGAAAHTVGVDSNGVSHHMYFDGW